MNRPKKFMSGEQVAFLNPIDGYMSEGLLLTYIELDEDEDHGDYKVQILWEGKKIDIWEDNVYKLGR